MKFLLVIITCVLSLQQISMNEIRMLYKQAVTNTEKAIVLEQKLANVSKEDSSVELIAYKGAVLALKSNRIKGAKEKRSLFVEAVGYVEHAIAKSPGNIEARFVRLGIQESIPKFLKYKKNIEEDKTFILSHYKDVKSKNLKKHIRDFVETSKSFNEEEKQLFFK